MTQRAAQRTKISFTSTNLEIIPLKYRDIAPSGGNDM